MNILFRYFSFVLILSISCNTPQKIVAQDVSFQIFYDNLSPYGQWVDFPSFGFVWIPMVDPDFFPYASNGHWVWTNYGWTWVSHYNWGWAPFHYGRWNYDDYFGWFWIPDNVWGPAWVAWRSGPGYYGWTPLGPGISINIVIEGAYYAPPHYWNFLPSNYMGRDDIIHYYGPRKNNQAFINNSTVINNTYIDERRNINYFIGPRKEDVQIATGNLVKSVELIENTKPGHSLENNQLKIYRPQISKSGTSDTRPSKIVDRNDVRPISQRYKANQKGKEEPRKEPAIREPLQKEQEIPKADQKDIQKEQRVPKIKTEVPEPGEQKESPRVLPQKENPMQEKIQTDIPPKPIPIMREEGEQERKKQLPDQHRQQQISPKADPNLSPKKTEPKIERKAPKNAISPKELKPDKKTPR